MKKLEKTTKLIAVLLTLAMTMALAFGCTAPAAPSEAPAAAPAEAPAEAPAAEEAAVEAAPEDTEAVAAAIQDAIARNEARTQVQSTWEGPTEGPAAAEGKKVAFIMDTAESSSSNDWNDGVKSASELLGWEFISFDGKGTVAGGLECFNQAIALGVNAIATNLDAEAMMEPILECESRGIAVIGVHGSNIQGPDAEHHLVFNICSNPSDIGYAMADYAIADSNGTGRVIILYDAQYAIARQKTEAMQERVESIPTMELLEVVNSPLADAATNMPTLISGWVATYGTPLYVLTIADIYYDYAAAALIAGGVSSEDVKLIGSDGTEAAYERIRTNEYQVVTIPEPPFLMGYIAVDAMNRYFNGVEPDPYQPSVYLVTPENVELEGGANSVFDPSSGYAEHYKTLWGK